jgi:hypothetical protein
MRKAFTYSIIFFNILLSHSYGQKDSSAKYSLFIESFSKEKIHGDSNWLVKCSLINHSKDTLEYWSMLCSWTDFYTVENKGMEIDGFECDKNFPITKLLEPNKTNTVVLRLFKKRDSKQLREKIKIGFVLIKANRTLNLNEMISSENIIWSNSIFP